MRVSIIGAHPDDAEFVAGGVTKKFTSIGHEVAWISMTTGDAGHHEQRGHELAQRRDQELWRSSQIAEAQYQILRHHDGRLFPSLEARDELIGIIRAQRPDLILTHRPNDYHPDHRYTSQLVQDASYLLTVPSIAPRVEHLSKMPVICYLEDQFTKPMPFEADIVVSIDDVIDDKIAMLDCHESQVYEWLPYNRGELEQAPLGQNERKQWLGEWIKERARATAERFRVGLSVLYGDRMGAEVEFAEAFEACEYGTPLTSLNRPDLFPFFGE